jgi:signal transduction histidine kinase
LEESSGIATMVLNDLINHDKIVMGSLSMELELVSLWHAISAAVKPFYLNARQAAVRLVVDSEFEQGEGEGRVGLERKCVLESLMVVGDSVKLSQVVRNLVSNALKFSSPGGEVTVTVRWDPGGLRDAPAVPTGSSSGTVSIAPSLIPGTSSRNAPPPWTGMPRAGSLVLTVRDGGAGMSAEDQMNLFREGIQFNANQLQRGGGSGLGLWIAKGTLP